MVRSRPEAALEAGETHVHRVQRVGGKIIFTRDESLARAYLKGSTERAHDSVLCRRLRDYRHSDFVRFLMDRFASCIWNYVERFQSDVGVIAGVPSKAMHLQTESFWWYSKIVFHVYKGANTKLFAIDVVDVFVGVVDRAVSFFGVEEHILQIVCARQEV